MATKTGLTVPQRFSSLLYNFVPSDFCTYEFNGRTPGRSMYNVTKSAGAASIVGAAYKRHNTVYNTLDICR